MKFDQTDLSITDGLKDNGAVRLHRDYIAHCFRWGFAARRCGRLKLNGNKRRILDFGCGKDVPLVDTIYESRLRDGFDSYVGVDLNTIKPRRNFLINNDKIDLLSNTNILDVTKDMIGEVNTVVSFEVLEHCPPETMKPILTHLLDLATDDAEFIYSTPVYSESRGMAKNHINEMTREHFKDLLETCGYNIIENYGTFASQSDYKQHLTPEHLKVFNELSRYHADAVLSNFFAPLYPKHSRNNLWVCRKGLI